MSNTYSVYLQLHDGKFNASASDSVDDALCGTSMPLPMRTTTSVMFVEFATDKQLADKGFRAYYSFHDGMFDSEDITSHGRPLE